MTRNSQIFSDGSGNAHIDPFGGSTIFAGNFLATMTAQVGVLVANQGTAQTTSNVTLSAGWGTGASVALAGPPVQYTQFNEFTITSGSGAFASAPTIQVVFPSSFPAAPVCSLVVSGITGAGGALIFQQTAESATQTTFTGTTYTGVSFTPATGETYTVVMHCGL